MHVCSYFGSLGSRIHELFLRGLRGLLRGLRTTMGRHWLCGRVVISVVVVVADRSERIGLVIFANDGTYTFIACSKYPPPPEVVIMGCVRPGSTYKDNH